MFIIEDSYFISVSGYVCLRFLIILYLYFINLLEGIFNMINCFICNNVERELR